MTQAHPFVLVTAFSHDPFGGNPAAVVFLKEDLASEALRNIALNFNQPIVSYVGAALPSTDKHTAAFDIRWYSTLSEVPLCGHGTIAAAKAIWGTPGIVSDDIETIEFHARSGVVLKVRKGDGRWFEIQLPAGSVEEVTNEEKERMRELLSQAFGKDIHLNFMGKGGPGFEHAVMVELEEKDDLAGSTVDTSKLLTTGWDVNIITTTSPDADTLFVSRMFAPKHLPGTGEDPVCGSAHCLLTPYWSRKLGVAKNKESKAKQVSARGGDLKVVWDEDKGLIRLMGELRILARGELLF